ncbi:monocarboxylate transporter 11-like [Strongylocentrotus purpuratus]|uniref:Uncharacterized protein n=1 Tax=Strongylocentrotus purpuratus TaxID=7668 RepID=A0A7M7NC78_STRPU|nr:monocarboxylate transporter 11-like [Strongylocentrotus purpuratus]
MDCMAKVGLVKSMGVLFQDVSRDLQMDSTDFGIALGLLLSVGSIASPIVIALYNRCPHPRLFMLLGAVMSPCCIILASFTNTKAVLQVGFTVSGLGHSMVRMPCLVALNRLAGDNFNIFYSLASCGHALGMVLYPFMAEELLTAYGWRGALVILAGLMFHEVPCLMTIQMPSKDIPSKDGEGLQDSHRDKLLAPLVEEPENESDIPIDKSRNAVHGHSPLSSIADVTQILLKWFRSTMIYLDPISLFIFLSHTSMVFVYSGWLSFLVPHALQRELSSHNIILLTFCAAVGSISARVSVGFLTHRLIRPIDMVLILSIMNTVVMVTDVYIPNLIVMLISSFCSSVSFAGRGTLGHLVIKARVSADHLAMSLAFLEVVAGSAVYFSGFIAGFTADTFSSYDASFKLLAIVDVFTFFLMLPVKIVKRRETSSCELK